MIRTRAGVIGYLLLAIGCGDVSEPPAVTAAPEMNVEVPAPVAPAAAESVAEPVADASAAGFAVGEAIDAAEAKALLAAVPPTISDERQVETTRLTKTAETKSVTTHQGAIR